LLVGLLAGGAFWLYVKSGKERATAPPVASAPAPAPAAPNVKAEPVPVPATATQTAPPATATRSNGPTRSRATLLSAEQGGQLLVASKDDWKLLVDGKEETSLYVDNGFGVFGFRDGKPALVDTFAIYVPDQSDANIKDFELFVGNASPTGPFESIGRFSTQNMRIMQNPYQEFRFPPVKAKYFKLQSLRSHTDSSGAVRAYEIQLFGQLQ
jgi:hypothetical protein